MENLTPIQQTQHDELLVLLTPLVEFMSKNNYNYFLLVGKDGIGSRHLRGTFDDITGMITGFASNNKEVEGMIKYSAENI